MTHLRGTKLGCMLTVLRKRASLTQREAARLAKLSTTRVAHIEQGQEVPPCRVLRMLCAAVRATPIEVVDVLTQAAVTRRRMVVSVGGLSEPQIRKLLWRAEIMRRASGLQAWCLACGAPPSDRCKRGCGAAKKGGAS